MDKNIKLIINGKIVDITDKSVSFVITKQTSDFNDITKRTGSFSYTIKLPKSKVNKQIFRYIDDLDVINKFNITTNFDAQLYVNDTIILDGIFILREVSKNYFEGNIVNKFGDIFSLLGSKSLRDLNLPTIDFEGIMLPMLNTGPNSLPEKYYSLTSDALNPNLGFDFRSLTEGWKDPSIGLSGSTIDYRDYYKTSFVQYSNFPVSSGKGINLTNTFFNDFNINDFMPQIKFNAIINQLFTDIGYKASIDNSLLNDENLIIPFTGDDPQWNWLHLSKVSVYTDLSTTKLESWSRSTDGTNRNGRYIRPKLIASKSLLTDWAPYPGTKDSRSAIISTLMDKQFTDEKYMGYPATFSTEYKMNLNTNNRNEFKVHYMLTNGINYDFNNNFSFYSPSPQVVGSGNRDSGWIYTVPVDGEYEFDLDINHDIEYFHHRRFGDNELVYGYFDVGSGTWVSYNPPQTQLNTDPSRYLYSYDYWKYNYGNSILGYEGDGQSDNASWNYNNKEMFELGNMVVFYKGTDDLTNQGSSLLSNYRSTFTNIDNSQGVGRYISRLKSCRKLQNIDDDDNILAFYHPMLRDLYNGGSNKVFEEWIQDKKTLYKNPQTYPITDIDKFNYFGFGKNTDILNFQNNITSTYQDLATYSLTGWTQFNRYESPAKQLQYKLVKAFTRSDRTADEDNQTPGFRNGSILVYPNKCSGNVKFKFKCKLTKGEQIRMYYVTTNGWRMVHNANNYEYIAPSGLLCGDMYQDGPWSGRDWDAANWSMKYSDFWSDEYKINSLKIRCISNDIYEDKLKLSNFLPDIKQKDFLNDFIKSNNLYFDVIDNNIIFKTRGDFYKKNTDVDITNKMDRDYESITPIEKLSQGYIFGFKIQENYDFYEFVSSENPPITTTLGDNLYLDQEVVDLTSKIFYSTYDRPSFYKTYPIIFPGRVRTSDTSNATFTDGVNIPSFQDDGDSKIPLNEVNTNYNRDNRILYWNGPFTNGMNNLPKNKLIGGAPFKHINLYQSVSNVGILLNTNKESIFSDQFLDLQDSSQIEWMAFLDELTFASLDLSKPVLIKNTLYYIQKIDQYNPLNTKMTKLVLLKL